MTKQEITAAIKKTIEEAKEYQRQHSGDDAPIIEMDRHRQGLEASLDFYDAFHPGPLRAIAQSIIIPAGFVLAPVIVAGGLIYLGGREIYQRLSNRKTRK